MPEPQENRINPGVRLPRDLYLRLLAIAKRERRSLNEQIVKMLEDAAPPADPDAETKHD